MTVRPEDLVSLPLFRGISQTHLTDLLGMLEQHTFPAGHVLFKSGEIPTRFQLLARGEITLLEGELSRFRLRAVAPIGELGALAGLPRHATGVTSTEVELLSVPLSSLMEFFERRGDVAFPFYHNMLNVVAEKVRRDRRHMDEMRANIVRTQRAMKELREVVLAATENELSRPVIDFLEDCIEHNRRAHYRVSPPALFSASVRLDDRKIIPVLEISDAALKLGCSREQLGSEGPEWSGVLMTPHYEIAVSGIVDRETEDGVVIRLDELAAPQRALVEDYMTRVDLLDFVV